METVLARRLGTGDTFAESWEISDLGTHQSIVECGPLADRSLHELVVRRGAGLLGRHCPRPRFPLLLKYLDAARRLSVQVHPDDAIAARMGLEDPGKTEAWLVLHAEPGSKIYAGFSQPVDRPLLQQALCQGECERLLHWFEPAAGQSVYIPAGTVHALGAGVLAAEIQQSSNNTFRLFDWNRLGPDGRPRKLHIEQGLEAIDYDQGPVGPANPQPTDREGVTRLVECDKFIWDRCEFFSPATAGGDERCHIISVLEGSVSVEGDRADQPLPRGRTALLPASCGTVKLIPNGDKVVLLDAYLP